MAQSFSARHLDADDFYWLPTDPPFTAKREPASRVAMIEREIDGVSNWVLSGSLCSWGGPLLDRFTLVIFLHLSPQVRMSRLQERERQRYGSRILPGGDMYEHHLEFIDWARSYDTAKSPVRSFDLHNAWMKQLDVPIMRLDASQPLEVLTELIRTQMTT